jgi:hypothetical protein
MLLGIIDGGSPTDFQELRSAELVRRLSDGPLRPNNLETNIFHGGK